MQNEGISSSTSQQHSVLTMCINNNFNVNNTDNDCNQHIDIIESKPEKPILDQETMLAVIAASCRVSKSVSRSGRTSPMSVDSGFDSSSFPSSPDSSNDTSILANTQHQPSSSTTTTKCISLISNNANHSVSISRNDIPVIITDEESCLSSSALSLPSESSQSQLSLPSDSLTLPSESPISLPSETPSSKSCLLSASSEPSLSAQPSTSLSPQPSYSTANTSSSNKSQEYPQQQVPSLSLFSNNDDNSLISADGIKSDIHIISTKNDLINNKTDNNNDKLINKSGDNERDDALSVKVSNEIKECGLKLSISESLSRSDCVLKCASIASSSASSSSLISISDNHYNNVNDNNNSELLSLCHWDRCVERFKCDNDLYDHVIKNHLEILRPLDCLSPNSRGKCSQKSRMKTLPCKWGNCKMVMSRGDLKKQFIWLEDHFTTRHAGRAQPYRCLIEGCSLRFTLKRALEDHLRSGHEKKKRSNSEENDSSKLKSCYQWTPVPYYPPCEDRDFLDSATDEWLVMRLREYERVTNGCLVVRDQEKRGGAQYRKRRRMLHFEIATFKQKPPTKMMCMSEKKRLLNDAFFSQHTGVHSTTANRNASLGKKQSNLRSTIK